MHLRRLELQGFKTFAAKTVLEFAPESAERRGTTAIVGPNGSGKSNIADAIRWVMGEQSMKILRGKKAEDLIFSGSQKKSRSGFAEVTMTLVNDLKDSEISMPEIVITRRLYRDGKSEFEINRRAAKLGDVALLLAQAGMGQRTYSVIGQGMIDAVLSASPAERKDFFDEAAGLRPFQLKRHQSVTKLQTSRERLAQAQALLGEIGPRLSTLQRQVRRLEQRDQLEAERADLERQYYGGAWHEIFGRMTEAQTAHDAARANEKKILNEAKELEKEFEKMEKQSPPSKKFELLRASLDAIADERASLRERQAKLQARMEIEKAKAAEPRAALSMSRIIEAAEAAQAKISRLVRLVQAPVADMEKIRKAVEDLHAEHLAFTAKLQVPAVRHSRTPVPAPEAKGGEADPKIREALEGIAKKMKELEERSGDAASKMDAWEKEEQGKRTHLFATQRRINEKRAAAQEAERKAGEQAVALARWETRRDAFLSELRLNQPDMEKGLNKLAQEVGKVKDADALLPRLTRLRSQIEWIGNIDPQTQKEYAETKERFEFLKSQIEDLKGAIRGLDTVIRELDDTIRTRSEKSFHALADAFSASFKALFGGGDAKIIQLPPEPAVDEDGNLVPPPPDAPPAGIDIQATPPGKRLKSIALLSGGERALTSIALISAIMATNPSPFIVLDEVDAALDEVNSKKYADIITGHAASTQFILVTHNRTTMHQAGVLYGVTLAEDGTSKVLSVKMEIGD
jgi:chromosome segregation ATPase